MTFIKPFPFSKREIYIIRHGETEWSKSGQHTGLTDIPLTEKGEKEAQRISLALKGMEFQHVFSSPLQRAHNTCLLAGFKNPIITKDLVEWNYGIYEGMTSKQIAEKDPNWKLFKEGAPEGESIDEVGKRADKVLAEWENLEGNIIVFSSGHFSRVLIARYLKLEIKQGHLFYISPSSISILGTEHNRPSLISLNTLCHLKQH